MQIYFRPLTGNFPFVTMAGKPPPGLHLDVVKGDKLAEAVLKNYTKNKDVLPVWNSNVSCIHSVLVHHMHLNRVFIIHLNVGVSSTARGTFLGRMRLEPHKPQQVPLDSSMAFGASTQLKAEEDEELKGLLGLPKEETDLQVRETNLCLLLSVLSRMSKKVWIQRGILLSFAKAAECEQLQTPDAFVKGTSFTGIFLPSCLDKWEGKLPAMQSMPVSGGLHEDLPPTSHEEATHPSPCSRALHCRHSKEAWPGKKRTPSLLI
uniref:Uncharacterized protein n=1 Tax=Amphilophus citrinellus TaxID=61819 RepID=A0A3Q0R1Y7_AMPCI